MGEMIPIAAILVGGLLLFPVVMVSAIRRLRVPRDAAPGRDQEIARLEAELTRAKEELHRLTERQQFIEALLEKRPDPTALPR